MIKIFDKNINGGFFLDSLLHLNIYCSFFCHSLVSKSFDM